MFFSTLLFLPLFILKHNEIIEYVGMYIDKRNLEKKIVKCHLYIYYIHIYTNDTYITNIYIYVCICI